MSHSAAPMTAGDALARAAKRLADAGVGAPRLDATLLLGAAMGMPREAVLLAGGRALDGGEAGRYRAFIARRAAREPVSRILGVREFWSLPLTIDAHGFDPRPDSETVIQASLAVIPDRRTAMAVLDLGAGSGALLLRWLTELPRTEGIGVDVSPGAAALARANAAALGLDADAGSSPAIGARRSTGASTSFSLIRPISRAPTSRGSAPKSGTSRCAPSTAAPTGSTATGRCCRMCAGSWPTAAPQSWSWAPGRARRCRRFAARAV